jgi:hypothetical protein
LQKLLGSFGFFDIFECQPIRDVRRFNVDAVLGTQQVHEEEWYELFSEMEETEGALGAQSAMRNRERR